MKRFNITVNGKAYDVAVEETTGGAAPVAAAPVAAPVAAPAPAAATAPAAPAGGEPVTAPMPGTILDIKVSVGTEVKEGQPVAVLEAMKMENDIPAAKSGKVVAINAKKGDSVQTGDVILTIA